MRVLLIIPRPQGVEDITEPAQDIRAGWLPQEQRGPAGCECEPLRHVHHSLSQGRLLNYYYHQIILVNICPPGPQLYRGHINGGQRSNPGHS